MSADRLPEAPPSPPDALPPPMDRPGLDRPSLGPAATPRSGDADPVDRGTRLSDLSSGGGSGGVPTFQSERLQPPKEGDRFIDRSLWLDVTKFYSHEGLAKGEKTWMLLLKEEPDVRQG